MSKFNLEEFIHQNPLRFSSTFHENFAARKNTASAPRWLEDVGISPSSVLGEGSFKNYLYERANAWHEPPPLGPTPLPGPRPL